MTGRSSARGWGWRWTGLWVGAGLVALVVLVALVSLLWTPHDPLAVNVADRLQPPSSSHLLGTDRLGRDVLSGLMAGARITLAVGAIAVAVGAVIGVPLGVLAAFKRNWLGQTLGRGFDLLLAFPGLLLAIVFAAAFGASTWSAALALGIGAVPAFARVAQAGARQVLGTEYVAAARVAGRSPWAIALTHVLPGIAGFLIVQASVAFGLAILAEAGLSYLGLGTPPPTPSWGRMLQDSQAFLGTHLNLILAPGLAIGLAVLGFNLLGDGLRDLLDPRLTTRR
ncbi:MAG: ABC transporter permease [Promicromonosporaceae bacterium]|nr:ABC transporter permease [Promicromonosporaceae bacterium]